ncbi:glutamate-cysteine ligase family protein [Dactylosporangium sp. CA-092794]|uniref:glutamate-cysteine ligase family protein n=1 Tax=Dactylosporangium sp. CA-092794 TaxID=3239929 RepID=UPI003D9287DA
MRTATAQEGIRRIDDAEGYIASICFKTGPPTTVGTEIEHVVHHGPHPTRPLDTAALAAALGPYAPPPLGAGRPLDRGAVLSAGPGGQLTLAARPQGGLAALHAAVTADLAQLTARLEPAGLRLAGTGIDAHRAPRRLLNSPRYHAMAASFARRGGEGRTMMCGTAGLRPDLDAGPAAGLADRWAAAHEIGPTLLAVFANSPLHAGRATGWASTRMRAWYGIDPARAGTVPVGPDPAAAWARYALRAPLLCVRRPTGSWTVPAGITFADWIGGALPGAGRPTYDDLDYHLGTLYPLVRPRGHLQIRYLDAQPVADWFAPVAVLTALLSDDAVADAAREVCAPAAGQWVEAARYGLTAPVFAVTAPRLLDLAWRAPAIAGLPSALRAEAAATIEGRFRQAAI